MQGKKTWFGLIILSVGVIVTEVGTAVQTGTVTGDSMVKIVGAVTTIVGAIDKIRRGV